jgi:hypothetical protein
MKKGWPKSVVSDHPLDKYPEASINIIEGGKKTVLKEDIHLAVNLNEEGFTKGINFDVCDLSIIICTYTRHQNLPLILDKFCQQDYSGTFELIVWNNNYQNSKELDALYQLHRDKINIKVIHSTMNIFCMPRIALRPLFRGSTVVFCDDDVIPKRNYLTHLVKKHREFGTNTVICLTGNSFLTTGVDETTSMPWKNLVKMHAPNDPECSVDYFHASTCILSSKLIQAASTFEMPSPETALVDDFWLSYILSHKLGTAFIKINSEAIADFTEDSSDRSKSMAKNKQVRYQRIAFLLYTRHQNWIRTKAECV